MNDVSSRPDVATLSYEQARDELVEVVSALENGSASLEDSLALWERGEALADRCQSWLDSAKEKLAKARGDHTAGPAAETTDDAATTDDAPGASAGEDSAATEDLATGEHGA